MLLIYILLYMIVLRFMSVTCSYLILALCSYMMILICSISDMFLPDISDIFLPDMSDIFPVNSRQAGVTQS